MPPPDDILAGLSEIAQRGFGWALFVHLLLGALGARWLLGRRLAASGVSLVLGLLLGSVCSLAFWFGMVFNGVVFFLLAGVLIASDFGHVPARSGVLPDWLARVVGGLLASFGWVYPHFLPDRAPLTYLVAAPLGLLPCPTLAFAAGIALVFPRSVSRPAACSLAGAALFYGLFGALRLGVRLDLLLVVGGMALVLHVFGGKRAAVRASAQPDAD